MKAPDTEAPDTSNTPTVGCHCAFDRKYRNASKVEVVQVYGRVFCRVRDMDTGVEWDTLLNRLTDCAILTKDKG